MHAVPLGNSVKGQLVLGSFTDVGPDPDSAMVEGGCDVLVSLVQADEIKMRYPDYAHWLESAGDRVIRLPIPDYGVTDDESLMELIAQIIQIVEGGRSVP